VQGEPDIHERIRYGRESDWVVRYGDFIIRFDKTLLKAGINFPNSDHPKAVKFRSTQSPHAGSTNNGHA
jgi:hypothetical protein